MIRFKDGGIKGTGRSQMTILPCCAAPGLEAEGNAGHRGSHSRQARLALMPPWAQPQSSFPWAHLWGCPGYLHGHYSSELQRERGLRVPWPARRSNESILKEICPGCSLEGLMLKLKLQYFGHLMRRGDSLEKTLMLGGIGGRRIRGQQRMRWLDGITN